MPTHWDSRDRKLNKRTKGMRVTGRSVFTMQEAQRKRDDRKAREWLRDKKESHDDNS